MSQDTNIPNLIINKLNKQQYEGITPNNTELYFITDEDAYLASNQGSGNVGKVLIVGNDGTVIPGNVTSVLPDQTGHAGEYLTTNGTDLSWANVPASVVVDQTYNAISTNAQAGIAVAEAVANKVDTSALANVAFTGNYEDLNNLPTIPTGFANIAFTGEYSDLINAPVFGSMAYTNTSDYTTTSNLANIALSGEYSDLVNAPVLANVATSGEYDDLLNKPSIPSPQVNSDWNATSGIAEILNKPTLSTVATSGDYNDLINKPTIPSNLANVAFTGDYNDLSNTPVLGTAAYADVGNFATAAEGNLATTAVQPGDLANVATTGEYSDLLNTPTIPAAQVNADWNAVSGVAQILNKPTLANVATTGEYGDLINAPVLANVATSGDYNDLTNKPTIPTNLANVAFTGEYDDLLNTPTIPTVSDATIVITQGGVQKGSFTLNQASGDTIALDAGGGGSSLPSQTGHGGEFLTTDGTDASWASLANIAISGEYSDLVNAPSLANVATTGEYSDLLNTPTIPNVPVVVQDFYVNGTTGAINCTFSATPNTKSVHTIIGNTAIAGTWSGNVFTPNTADDILNNANGFVVSVF